MEEVIDFCREQPDAPATSVKKRTCAQEALQHRRQRLVCLVGAQEKPPFNIGGIVAKQSAVLGTDIDGKSCRRAKNEPARRYSGSADRLATYWNI
jgi:hypothetical protein